MAIGFSDGATYEDWPEFYTKRQGLTEDDDPGLDERETRGFISHERHNMNDMRIEDPSIRNTPAIVPYNIPNFNKGDAQWDKIVDTSHKVPLIASALTKDGSTMHGLAVDHRVNLAMNFEGKDHDITPFLWAHEEAELGPMAAAVKGGMNAKDAYELAHDKVANPAEAAVRNSYAITHGLDVDKFNEAYWSHINTQKDIAAQTSGQGKHPDAHTTIYGLDPPDKTPEEEEQLIHQYEDDFSTK